MARYIDADALIAKGWRLERHAPSGMVISEMSIADVPTAEVAEVRHGHWIHKVKRYPYQPDDCEAVCSVCGMDYALDPEYTIKYFAMHNKFCPNCGARMDGDAE